MADPLLLDTSAILAFIKDEPGADQVEAALLDAEAGVLLLHGCFGTLTEVDYITRQERSGPAAEQRVRDLLRLPIRWVHSDDALCSTAAKLKANHRVSFADAFVAAATLRFDATLVHRDPEFLPLRPTLRQLVLPPKV